MSRAAESARQQALLAALRSPSADAVPPGVQGPRAGVAQALSGLRAYRANAQAVAQRSLASAYPVLARLLGEEAMAALARDLWRVEPPVKGDLAWFGAGMAGWLAQVEAFKDLPYLPDVARLEWVVHRAQVAADPPEAPVDLGPLAGDPDKVIALLAAGSAVVASPWPVFRLWQAHQDAPDTEPELGEVRAALAAGEGDCAWVWRKGHRVEVAVLSASEHELHCRLLAGEPLGAALGGTLEGHPDFSFERWLTRALREGWLAGFAAVSSHP